MFNLINGDCLEAMKNIEDKSIDLIIIDPPYKIQTRGGGNGSKFAISLQGMCDDLFNAKIVDGIEYLSVLPRLIQLQQDINIYIWCNKAQIILYLDFFVTKRKCKFEIIKWVKPDAMPTYYNKYLTDTEYCLYFQSGGKCKPKNYQDASTLFQAKINRKDKKLYGHPTCKPVEILERLIRNSSNEGDTILDCFMGSGSTGIACKKLNRKFIGIEMDKNYFKIAKDRIENHIPEKEKNENILDMF